MLTVHPGFQRPTVSATPIYRARDHLATRDSRRLRCRGIPIHSPLSLPWPGLDPSPSPGPVRLGPGHLFRYKKSPCGHAAAQKCSFLGTKRPLWACYCSEMLFLGTKKACWACYCSEMLFVRYNKNCGHVTAQKCYFLGTKKAPAGMLLLIIFISRYKKSPCRHVTTQKCYF